MSTEIKPCKRCGSELHGNVQGRHEGNKFVVMNCGNCDYVTQWHETLDLAIAEWNNPVELKSCMRCGSDRMSVTTNTNFDWKVWCCKCGIRTAWFSSSEAAIADWNTRPDPWVLTSERLPDEGVPVWAEVQRWNDTSIRSLVRIPSGWYFIHDPFLDNAGRWGFLLGSAYGFNPKRWRYML